MCGIAGIVNIDGAPVPSDILEKMNLAMIHRGPDDGGIFVDGCVGLAHRRLSIIDLEHGKQPMCNEDGSVWTVFNGEIYNSAELRAQMESKGHIFKTSCDTETIVHLYEEFGSEFVNRLNGMFALAVYDVKEKIIILARDRLGQKPLLYFRQKGKFVFASEMQALRQHPDMPGEFSLQAVHDYLSLQYVPSPSTIYQGVSKLPPAHILEFKVDADKLRVRKYWNIDYSKKTSLSYEDAREQLKELLEDSVRKRLMSDVPFGAFLSGGLDSSIIVALMSKICDEPVKAFTIGFDEALYDERKFANIAVNFINSNGSSKKVEHINKIVKPDDFSLVKNLVNHYGEPYCDASMLPTYLLSRFTRENVKVALSGDGADELFAGYNRYLVMKFAKYADCLPLGVRKKIFGGISKLLPPKTEERTRIGQLQRILAICASHSDRRYLDLISRFDEDRKSSVYGDAFADFKPHSTQDAMKALYGLATSKCSVEKIMETDLHSYLSGDILTKIDIASMAASLEVRCPFMDHRVVEFAASLPLEFKQRNASRKHILKDAFKDIVPEKLISRKKMGFGVPVAKWFRSKWDKPLRDNLLGGNSVKDGYFRQDALEKLIQEHQAMKADHSYALWALLVFEVFLSNSKSK